MTTLGLDFKIKLSDEKINAQLKLVDLEDRDSIFPATVRGYETTCGTMSSACA